MNLDPNAQGNIQAAIERLLERVGEAVTNDAQRVVAVDSGYLKSRIRCGPVEDDTIRVWADAEYATAVELGTSDTPAQPYLRPALYQKRVL